MAPSLALSVLASMPWSSHRALRLHGLNNAETSQQGTTMVEISFITHARSESMLGRCRPETSGESATVRSSGNERVPVEWNR